MTRYNDMPGDVQTTAGEDCPECGRPLCGVLRRTGFGETRIVHCHECDYIHHELLGRSDPPPEQIRLFEAT